jgi:hypothetical protein
VERHGYEYDRKYREQEGYRRVMRSGRFQGWDLAPGLFPDLAQILPGPVHELPVPACGQEEDANQDSDSRHAITVRRP